MATQDDTGFLTRPTAEALAFSRCARLDANKALVYCDDEEEPLGVTQHAAASGANCTIKLLTAPGTFKIEASTTVTFAVTTDERGTPLYTDADGKVSGTGTNQKFCALEGASAAGSIIECIPVFNSANTGA